MIKSNELRVGNIVQRNGDWKLEKEGFHTIIAINSNDSPDKTFDSVRTDVTGQDFLFTAQLEAIPIKEEVLLYFGFERLASKRPDHANYIKEHKFLKLNIFWYKNKGFFVSGINLTYTLKYVHQLQNLYFALNGEELTIKQAIENL